MSGLHSEPLTAPFEALYWTQYGTWYPLFRKHAPKSTVIDIDAVQPELLHWFEAETFVLPDGSGPSTSSLSNHTNCSSSSLSTLSDATDEADDDEEDDGEKAIRLPSLDAAIRAVVDKYDGGPVFPKLNWSAPLDAGFMLPGNNLQCLHPEDVYLLLKSSEFVGRDLEQISHVHATSFSAETDIGSGTTGSCDGQLDIAAHAGAHTSDAKASYRIRPQLVLKKWFQFARSYEFRCFVRAHHLIAISQRDVTFYDHLQSPHLQSQIRSAIWAFWENVLDAARRRQQWPLADYVFDVYLTKDLARVWLVDINAWLPRTDPLLWSFDELEQVHRHQVQCRTEQSASRQDETQQDVVRLRIAATSPPENNPDQGPVQHEAETDGYEWDEWDVQLRVLADRRMQTSGGTGATYSSNMVPTDLVEYAKSSSTSLNTGGGASAQGMSVDQIVTRCNEQTEAEERARTSG